MAFTKEDAIRFGKVSASVALDQVSEYESDQFAIDTYREDVIDTLTYEKSLEWLDDALAVFDAYITANRIIRKPRQIDWDTLI